MAKLDRESRMARPRKPLDVLKVTGAYRADRHADRENAPKPTGEPAMPQWLDEEASAFWQATVPELAAMGVARSVDGPALAGMCRWDGRVPLGLACATGTGNVI